MKENYKSALAAVLKYEGGYTNHPADPGGPTNKGVTQRVYDAWRKKHGLGAQSVRSISQEEVEAIYRRDYWDAVHGDDLPSGLDGAVFDYAVNSGPSRAIKALQRVLGVPADGIVGPQTINAAIANPKACGALCDERLGFMKRLKTWPVFGRGWGDRVSGVKRKALALAEKAPVVAGKAIIHEQEKSIFDGILDTIDWTRDSKENTQQAPPPSQYHDALHTYLVPAIVAFLGALSSQDWNDALSSNPSVSITVIFIGAASAAYKAAAPWWAQMIWKGPKIA